MVGKKDIKRFVKKFSLLAVLFSFFITACGDSDGGANASTNAGTAALDEVYASEDDLPGCTEKYDGAVAFVKEGSTAFKCEDGRWEKKGEYYANNDAIKNCTAKREGEVAYIVDEDKSLVCQDGKWVKVSDKVGEPAKESSSSNGEITSNSSSSRNDEKGAISSSSSSWSETIESSSLAKGSEPAEGVSSSNASSSSSWNEVTGSSSSSRHSGLDPKYSSSAQAPSSSSAKESSSSVASSSSAVELNCSALLEEENGWSWDIPKECRFNPAITYGNMTDKRDNRAYKTIKIGSQTWLAENLNYADSTKTPSLLKRSWCYDNVAKNCEVAGRLYTWAAAIDSVKLYNGGKGVDCGFGKTCTLPAKVQGICPSGWHLPDTTEWRTLFTEVGVKSMVGGAKLKSQTGWYNSGNGTDAYGFSALPVGNRAPSGSFGNEGGYTEFWSARIMQENAFNAYRMLLYDVGDGAYLGFSYKDSGHPVRCVKD